MRTSLLIITAAFLCGCRPYADFTLPVLTPRGGAVSYSWEVRPDPVLTRDSDVDALNPAVVRYDGKLYNFFSAFDGKTWHTALAMSSDGMRWERKGKVLSPDPATWEGDYIAANGTALHAGKIFFYWYQGNRVPRIGLATSLDGMAWNKQPKPVLEPGPSGSWDEMGVADPYVVQAGDMFYLYYLGQDRAKRQRLGVARSKDGLNWEKLRTNPVLELGGPGMFDEIGLGEPAVWKSQDSYWMLYTGRDRAENRRLGLARSQDGVKWQRVSENAVLSGEQPWMSKVVCDPTVEVSGSQVHVWFGGGDVAQPAENLHGQIGYATLMLSVQ